jgi:ATP-dependent RNA helicase DDX56/DBP9
MKITADEKKETQEPRLRECPDIIIATPGRIVDHLESGNIRLTRLQIVVIDEADLVMSFGYKNDLDKLKAFLPSVCQGFLMSATLSDDVTTIKKLILHTPVVLEVEEKEPSKLKQYVISCNTTDKFLIFYVLLKLRLLLGKSLVFVNTIERCFQLKLFLERLSIRSAVLNSDLPQNSRYHIVHDFNCGIFEILIATDSTETNDNQKLKQKASKQLQKTTSKKPHQKSDPSASQSASDDEDPQLEDDDDFEDDDLEDDLADDSENIPPTKGEEGTFALLSTEEDFIEIKQPQKKKKRR